MESVLYDAPPALAPMRPGIPASLVEALLAQDRHARPTEASTVATELRAELATLGQPPHFPSRLMESPTSAPSKPHRLRPALAEQSSPAMGAEAMRPEVPPTLPLEQARSEAPTQALGYRQPPKPAPPSVPSVARAPGPCPGAIRRGARACSYSPASFTHTRETRWPGR